MTLRWDNHFLDLALAHSAMSKDPATRVGAILVGPDREVRSAGFNGFPRGIADLPERLHDRATKLDLIIHAELNALIQAARVGVSVKGCTLYLAATDDTGQVWGGPPCVRCTVHVIQAGITRIVSRPQKPGPSKWHTDLATARALLCEAVIPLDEVAMSPTPLPDPLENRANELVAEITNQAERLVSYGVGGSLSDRIRELARARLTSWEWEILETMGGPPQLVIRRHLG